MTWRGINRETSEVDQTPKLSIWQQNVTMDKESDLRRRPGFLSSLIAKQAGAIYGIVGAGPWNGSFITLNVGNGSTVGGGTIIGDGGPIVIPIPPRKPKFPPPMPKNCKQWVDEAFNGDVDDTVSKNFDANSCPGRIIMTGVEDAGRSRGTAYGYQFLVDVDGLNVFASDCLVNDAVTYNFPKGTRRVNVHIVGNCIGTASVGTWDVSVEMI